MPGSRLRKPARHQFARVTGHRDGPNLDEDRFWQQSTYRIGQRLDGALSGRSRLEPRFRDSGTDTGWRARQLFSYSRRFEGTPISLVLAHEIFFGLNDADWGQRSGFDQNRAFFGGGAWYPAPGVRLEAGYSNNLLDLGGSNQTDHNFAVAFLSLGEVHGRRGGLPTAGPVRCTIART